MELVELEAELRSLRPKELSPEFAARIERVLVPSARDAFARETIKFSAWVSWPMAACFVGAMAWLSGLPREAATSSGDVPGAKVSSTAYQPIGAANILYDVRNEGYTTLPDGRPALQVRDRYVDVITWKNAASASVSWSVPRDEVQLIPLEAY